MKTRLVNFILLVVALLTPTFSLNAQGKYDVWLCDYDGNGNPYILTSVPDSQDFWGLGIAFSYDWGMMFTMHINGELLQVWQPTLTFNGTYKVKPDDFNGKEMSLYTANQIYKIKEMLDSGDCKIVVSFYLNGEQKSRTFHYRYYKNAFINAVNHYLD